LNLEEFIESKLKDSCYLVRLSTGELLLSLIVSKTESVLSIAFPYEILDTALVPFCHFSSTRIFDISLMAIQFVKKPKDKMVDKFFEYVMKQSKEEFRMFAEPILASHNEELSSEGHTIH